MALRFTIGDAAFTAGIVIGVLLLVVTPSVLCVSPSDARITPETHFFYSLLCIGSWAAFVALIAGGFLFLVAPHLSF